MRCTQWVHHVCLGLVTLRILGAVTVVGEMGPPLDQVIVPKVLVVIVVVADGVTVLRTVPGIKVPLVVPLVPNRGVGLSLRALLLLLEEVSCQCQCRRYGSVRFCLLHRPALLLWCGHLQVLVASQLRLYPCQWLVRVSVTPLVSHQVMLLVKGLFLFSQGQCQCKACMLSASQ